ncbi:hypothetical protein [Pseudomonas sp. MWU13-2517]|uniref:hypothetical protein n=1 Tax=Pseudomonas sp. MWU13-2517 TaxID=2929055 RepID=UPI00200D3EDF|nr:hypothetical protein [Pseudomonas sp. MWU13-2517]
MNIRNGLNVFLLVLLHCSSVAQGEERGLCALTETKVASCETTKGKLVSICSSKNRGEAYYRFGTPSDVQLEVKFHLGRELYRWFDLSTFIMFFGFEDSGYSYVFGVPQETLGARAYLHVRKAASVFSYEDTFMCHSNSFGDKSLASTAITDVADEVVRTKDGLVFPPHRGHGARTSATNTRHSSVVATTPTAHATAR